MEKTVIDSNDKNWLPDFKELIRYKDLFLILAYRDYRVRYAQTFIGFLWAFSQPMIYLLLAFGFGRVAEVKTDIPYILIAICGIFPWSFFGFTLSQSAESLIGSQNMIQKVYFPRLIIPLAKSVVGLIDFLIAGVMAAGLMIYYQVMPTSSIVLLPLAILLLMMAALGVGIWVSALTIRFRDLKHVVPFSVQIGMLASPIYYESTFWTEKWVNTANEWLCVIYYLNPMAGVCDLMRGALLDAHVDWGNVSVSIVVSVVLFATSVIYFRKVENIIADIV